MGTFEQFIEECGLEEVNADILSVRKELVGLHLSKWLFNENQSDSLSSSGQDF